MNILLVVREFSPTGNGGISYHVTHLSQALEGLGHDTTVLCSQEASDISETSSNKNIYTVNPVSYLPKQPSFNIGARNMIPRIVQEENIDLVQYHSPGWWSSIPEVTQLYKVHMCFSANFGLLSDLARDAGVKTIPQAALYSFYGKTVSKSMESASLSIADGIIYNSILVESQINNHFGIDAPGVSIPNGIDPTIFYPRSTSASDSYLLHVGGSRIKGIDRLLEAWDAYEGPIEQLKIAGGIRLKKDRTYAKQMDSVELLGKVSQSKLAQLYTGAEALVHPARYEPFGNVAFESVACGTPVITSKETVGAADFLPEEGLLPVNVDDITSIRAQLETLQEMRTQIHPEIINEFVANNTWERVATDTIGFYQVLK